MKRIYVFSLSLLLLLSSIISTIANGIIGHSGIASDYQNILHIPGYNELVRTDPISTFMNRYKDGWIDVYRYNDNLAGLKAARWAKDNYMNSNATYKITKNLTTTHETYCSKIVFQAYFYGIGQNTIHSSWLPVLNDTIMPPYSLPNVLSGGSYTLNYIGSL